MITITCDHCGGTIKFMAIGIDDNGNSTKIDHEAIIGIVTNHFGIKREQLNEETRTRYIVEARQIAMFLLKKFTNYTLLKIGEIFGKRDHTTVIHSLNKVNELMETIPEYRDRIEYFKKVYIQHKNINGHKPDNENGIKGTEVAGK